MLLFFIEDLQIMKKCITYISKIKSSIFINWQEKVIITSLNNSDLCEITIQNLPFLFYKKTNQNISILFETIEYFDETTKLIFVKNFRIFMCAMYGKTICQNNKITCQKELFCIECDRNKIKCDLQTCLSDNKCNKILNEYWKILLLSFMNDSNTAIKCEVIKNISMVINHFYPDSFFRNQMLTLINDKDEEVRIQCSKVLSSIIFEKDSAGNIQVVESYVSKMLNFLCSTVNSSLKLGNDKLQYTCLETIFNIGW